MRAGCQPNDAGRVAGFNTRPGHRGKHAALMKEEDYANNNNARRSHVIRSHAIQSPAMEWGSVARLLGQPL